MINKKKFQLQYSKHCQIKEQLIQLINQYCIQGKQSIPDNVKTEFIKKFQEYGNQAKIDHEFFDQNLQFRFKYEELISQIINDFTNLDIKHIHNSINKILKKIAKLLSINRILLTINLPDSYFNNIYEWSIDQVKMINSDLKEFLENYFINIINKKKSKSKYIAILNFKSQMKNSQIYCNINSLLAVPLIIGEKIIGYLTLYTIRYQRPWSQDEKNLLLNISQIFSNYINLTLNQHQLQEQEEHFRTVVQTANSIILEWDIEGRILFINQYGLNFFQYSAGEIIGQNIIGTILPEYLSSQELLTSIFQQATHYQQNFNWNILKDGTQKYIGWTNTIIKNDKGNIVKIISIGNDLTENKKMEELIQLNNSRLEALEQINQIGEESIEQTMQYALEKGVNLTDSKVGYLYLFDTHKEVDFFSYPIQNKSKNPNQDNILFEVAKKFKFETSLGPILNNNFTQIDPDKFFFKGFPEIKTHMAIPIYLDKQLKMIIGVCNKKEKYNELDLKQLTLLMEGVINVIKKIQLAQLREEVDRIIRHDLKTPLTSIIGYPDLILDDDNLSPEQINYLKIIQNSGKKMLKQIDNSMAIFKIEQGTYTLKLESVNIYKIFIDIQNNLTSLINFKKIQIKYFLNQNLSNNYTEFLFYGDSDLIYGICANLLKNALEASPDNNIVTVRLSNINFYEIQVHNIGIIPEEIRNNFFDKLITYGKKGGTGLGTYIIKLFVQTHMGKVYFESTNDTGTTLFVQIPKNK